MPNKRRRLIGRVSSAKMDKTIVVKVDVAKRHPIYDKVLHETRKYYAHDERNEAQEGDLVQIVESRPLSRLKRWALERILERREAAQMTISAAEEGSN
ncbi:MAG: 30S ribosomal protein S17 [Anaerolineae bacterium]|nr:30S ribosomal protein S17 [Anaerolineae bacterium]MDW8298235.1 30S ribosomal protein S17 [Anaerolineae bacterium]